MKFDAEYVQNYIVKQENKFKFERILKLAGISVQERILDIGCGNAQILKSIIPKAYVGIDGSEDFIKLNEANYKNRQTQTNFYVGDISNIFDILKKSSNGPENVLNFDVIFLVDVANILTTKLDEIFFSRLAKLLNPEGRIVIYGPNSQNILMRIKQNKFVSRIYTRYSKSNYIIGSSQTSELIQVLVKSSFQVSALNLTHHRSSIRKIEEGIKRIHQSYTNKACTLIIAAIGSE